MAQTDPLRNPSNFLWKTWRTLGLPDPSPLQYDFMEYLSEGQAWRQIEEEAQKETALGIVGPAKRILMAFRGAAKTYVATTKSVHTLYIDRLAETLIVSATDGYASAISTMAFQMVTQFDWLAPELAPSKDQPQSALSFDVRGRPPSKDRSFAARGIFGQITGLRATDILGDDLETPNTSETETKRTQLRHRMGELAGAILKPGGRITLLGTPQNEQTVYREYADDKGYELRIYPCYFPRNPQDAQKKYGTRLAPFIQKQVEENPSLAGTSTEPSRFTEADLLARKVEWGNTEFERQFEMDMEAGAKNLYPLKLRDLIAVDLAPPPQGQKLKLPSQMAWATMHSQKVRDVHLDSLSGDGSVFHPLGLDVWLPAEEIVCAVDPSGEGADETAWTILASLGGRVFLLHQGASTEGHTDKTLQAIASDCALWGVQLVKVESNFGGGMFSSLLRPHLTKANSKADIEDAKTSNQLNKERRIVETLEPLMTSHRLVVNTGVFRSDFDVSHLKLVEEAKRRFYRLTYQLTRMTKQRGCVKHDDRADSLAAGCAHFAERMQKTLDKEGQESKDRALELEAEKIIAWRKKMGLPVVGWQDEPNSEGFGRDRRGQSRPSRDDRMGHNGGPPLDD